MHSSRLLFALFLLFALGACSRRTLLPIEPLALRAPSYHPVPERTGVRVPAQLANVTVHPLAPVTPAVPSPADLYERAYQEMAKMLDGRYPLSFKRAVYLTENAYLDDQLDYRQFNWAIDDLVRVCQTVERQSGPHLLYDRADKASVLHHAALFKVLKDSTRFLSGRVQAPYRYDFDDFNGDRDWRKMFVSKLLATHKGNCHSLPFLYKILSDEVGAKTWLALAPNHIYVKAHNEKEGWYNTELTSRTFPNDAWLTASGYVSKEMIISGIYMDTLSPKQNVVLCLVDLAKGYERKAGRTESEAFVLKCADLALQHFPQYITAQLVQAEALRRRYERQPSHSAAAGQAYAAMETAYTRIFETGYREMPPQMYADWLRAVVVEKQKYQQKP